MPPFYFSLKLLDLMLLCCHDMMRLLICFYFHECELISQALILGLQCCQLFLTVNVLLLRLYRELLIFLHGETRTIVVHVNFFMEQDGDRVG